MAFLMKELESSGVAGGGGRRTGRCIGEDKGGDVVFELRGVNALVTVVKGKEGSKGRVTLEKKRGMARLSRWGKAELQKLDGIGKLLCGGRASCPEREPYLLIGLEGLQRFVR